MSNRIKDKIQNAGWLFIGATAIGAEKVINQAKHIKSEVQQGNPQALFRYKVTELKTMYKRKSSNETNESVPNHAS